MAVKKDVSFRREQRKIIRTDKFDRFEVVDPTGAMAGAVYISKTVTRAPGFNLGGAFEVVFDVKGE